MYPYQRPRRLRKSQAIRDLVKETRLHPDDFIVPLFIVEGKNIKEEIPSMPNYYRMSLDLIKQEVKDLWNMGLKSVLLFVKVDDTLKDNTGLAAIDDNGLMQQAIKTIKNAVPELYVMTDVALDPFSSLGHDGIVKHGKIINDKSVQMLAKMA
ncbi:MAG: porphobilinogen synthase, partial [Bacteroidetes bacterium]|nr:porphobilinogen synthase [Bacteroidota bacterium]